MFLPLANGYFWYFSVLGMFVPFFGLFMDGRGFNSLAIGEILAIVTATRIVGPTLWAAFADKSGKLLFIIQLGAFLAFISFVSLLWADTYWTITLSMAFFTLFWTAILPQLEVLTLSSIKRSAKIYSRIRLWGSIGYIALAVVGGKVIEINGTEAFAWLGIFLMFVLWLSSYWLKQPTKISSKTVESFGISQKLLSPIFLVFFVSGLLLQLSFGPYYGFFSLYLRDLAYPSYAVGLFIGISVVAEIVVLIYAGKIFKHVSIKQALIASFAFTVLRWWLTGYAADNVYVLIFSQITHAASFGLYHCASIQFLQRYFNRSQQSRGQAIYIGGVYGVGGALGAYLAGLLWANGAGSQESFNMAILSALVGLVLVFFLPKQQNFSTKIN